MRRRMEGTSTLRWSPSPGAPELTLYAPRFATAGAPARLHRVQAGDRLDNLAATYLGDPHAGWRIVDANPTLSPEDLLEPGRVLVIPERAG